jgi:hypothetical protein
VFAKTVKERVGEMSLLGKWKYARHVAEAGMMEMKNSRSVNGSIGKKKCEREGLF